MPISKKNEIRLNVEVGVRNDEDQYVGAYSPLRPVPKEKETGLFGAVIARTLPAKYVAWHDDIVAKATIALTGKGNLFERDPNFDPVKVWEDGKHSPDEFNTISNMRNMLEYTTYKQNRETQMKAAIAVNEAGFFGGAFDFLVSTLTDPTTYFGFGAANMLSKGMSASRSYSIAAAGAVATSEAAEQALDLAEMRSAADSAIAVGAAGVFGGLLGGAVDIWAKKNPTKNFTEESVKAVKEVSQIRAKADELFPKEDSVGAMRNPNVVSPDPRASMVAGKFAYGAARVYSAFRLSPAVRGQVAKLEETRNVTSKFFERTLMTESDISGEARPSSFIGNHLLEEAEYRGKVQEYNDLENSLIKSGKVVDEQVYSEAYDKAINGAIDADTPSGIIASKMREYFDGFAEKFKDAEDFNFRQNYIPMAIKDGVLDDDNAFKLFANTVKEQWQKSIPAIKDDIKKLKSRIENIRKKLEENLPSLEKARLTKTRDKYIKEYNKYLDMVSRSEADMLNDAMIFAEKVRNNDAYVDFLYQPNASKEYPSEFMGRVFDQKLFQPFLEKNPMVLMNTYGRNVSPYSASLKTFGETNPSNFIESYKTGGYEKTVDLPTKEKDKLISEIDSTVKDMSNAWDSLTGQNLVKAKELYGTPVYNMLQSAKAFTNATALSASLLASITELAAPLLVQGFRGQAGFLEALGKQMASPELRSAVKKNGKFLSHAMSTAVHMKLAGHYAHEMANQSIGRQSVTGKIAHGSQVMSGYSMVANGQVPYTSLIRNTARLMQEREIFKSIEGLAKGSLNKTKKADLAYLGIDEHDAKDILDLAKIHGEEIDGFFFFNTQDWANKTLADKLNLALIRDNRRLSLQPTVGDVPHAFRDPAIGLLFQFKSWSVTAGHTYGLSALQKTDAQQLMATSTYIGFASLAYMIAEVARGNEPPKDVDEILYAGITNSGLLGVMPDYGGHWLAAKLLDIESGGAKFAEIKDPREMLLGPLYSKAGDVFGVAKPIFNTIDPEKEVELDNAFWRDLIDLTPTPFIKPITKNVFFPTEE